MLICMGLFISSFSVHEARISWASAFPGPGVNLAIGREFPGRLFCQDCK